MEHTDTEIQSVQLTDDTIIVNYANDAVETLPNNIDTYRAFYNLWLKDDPPFISDIHKILMRNIILASIQSNNETAVNELYNFFSHPNEEAVQRFLTYMRNRVKFLPEKKAMWTPIS